MQVFKICIIHQSGWCCIQHTSCNTLSNMPSRVQHRGIHQYCVPSFLKWLVSHGGFLIMAASNPCCLPPYLFIPTISKWSVGVGVGGDTRITVSVCPGYGQKMSPEPAQPFRNRFFSVWWCMTMSRSVMREKKKKKKYTSSSSMWKKYTSSSFMSSETSYGLLRTWGGVCVCVGGGVT